MNDAPPGERELRTLLANMTPMLEGETFVFASLNDSAQLSGLAPTLRYEEREGTTLVLSRQEAERAGIAGVFPSRRITLNVSSALDAVGFLARLLPPLAKAGIGVNVVSAFHHDHLYVPENRAAEALAILRDLSSEARAAGG